MHSNVGREKISPTSWALKTIGGHGADEYTRRYWRKTSKRNNGKKPKTLRRFRRGLAPMTGVTYD